MELSKPCPVVVFTRACPSKSLSKEYVPCLALPLRSLTFSFQNSTIKVSECQTSIRIAQHETKSSQTFQFAHCFQARATNLDLASKFYPHVSQAVQAGTNLSIFAYGQKSSGKTYSFFGSSERGTIHHLLNLLLPSARSAQEQASSGGDALAVSHFEIYNETVLDFFASKKKFLRVTEDRETGRARVQGLSTCKVRCAEECIRLLDNANVLRKTRPQAHVVFQLEFANGSRISFIDLCASNERSMQNFTLTEMDPSLRHLTRVIGAINAQTEPRESIPFRDSLLTWLFQDSFAGPNTQTLVLACLSAENRDLQMTLDTLAFAQLCQSVNTTVARGGGEETLAQQQLERTAVFESSIASASMSSSCNTSNEALQLLAQEEEEGENAPNKSNVQVLTAAAAAPRLSATASQYEADIAKYRARALKAESERNAMTEQLREAFAVLEQQIDNVKKESDEAREQAKEARYLAFEAQTALAEREQELFALRQSMGSSTVNAMMGQQEQLEVQALAEHAAVFTIQCMWRKYQRRITARKHAEECDWYQGEIKNYAEENAMLKVNLSLYQEQEVLCTSLLQKVEYYKALSEDKTAQCQDLEERVARVEAEAMARASAQDLEEAVEHVRACEVQPLVEQLAELQTRLELSEETVRGLRAKMEAEESEEHRNADKEMNCLYAKISSLELQRDVAAQQLQDGEEAAQNKLREMEREHARRETLLQSQVDETQRNVEHLQREIKQVRRALEDAKAAHERELKESVAAASAAAAHNHQQRRSVGESFMFHYRDSRIPTTPLQPPATAAHARGRLSAIPSMGGGCAASALLPLNEETQIVSTATPASGGGAPEDFLCVRVDVEDCDGKSFTPCLSTVSPADPDVRTFQVKSPLFDPRNGRWCRIRIKLLNSSSFPVRAAEGIMLEHLLPQNRAMLHQMEVVKTETSTNGAIQSLTVQWDTAASATCMRHGGGSAQSLSSSSPATASLLEDVDRTASTIVSAEHHAAHMGFGGKHERCFCFDRSVEESGPMILHAKFHMGDNRTIHWKFPLRFKTPMGPRFVPASLKTFFARRNNRACDENKFGYLNSSWFPIPQQAQVMTDAEPVNDSHRVIAFQGYLQKTQSHLHHHRVQRWFVFAPPFLLCYDTAEKAVEDFSNGRALPHGANRALQIDAVHTRLRVLPSRVAGVERTEFEVATAEKKWTLQASNEEDLSRWTAALNNWIVRERELDAANNPLRSLLMVGGSLEFVPEGDSSLDIVEEEREGRNHDDYGENSSTMIIAAASNNSHQMTAMSISSIM